MIKLTDIDKELLKEVADMHSVPQGSFNIRKNGQSIERKSDDEVSIVPKKDKSGIDIFVKPGVKNRSVHIPVIVTLGNFNDLVYNDFYIGKGAEVFIVAGCGIHNPTNQKSEHDGIHTFHLEEDCKVKYIEKHLGIGNNQGEKILNPTTEIYMKSGCQASPDGGYLPHLWLRGHRPDHRSHRCRPHRHRVPHRGQLRRPR